MGLISRVSSRTYRARNRVKTQKKSTQNGENSTRPPTSSRQRPTPRQKTPKIRLRRNGSSSQPSYLDPSRWRIRRHVYSKTIHDFDFRPGRFEFFSFYGNLLLVCCR